jgi:hypothetical protein
MLLKPPIELRRLLAGESQLRLALSVVQTRPERHGQICSFTGWQFQQVTQNVRIHALILPRPTPFGKPLMLSPERWPSPARRRSVWVHGVVSNWLSVRPQFVLAHVDVVIPRDAVASGIDVHRSEKGRVSEQAELGPGEERSTVVGPFLAIPEANQ